MNNTMEAYRVYLSLRLHFTSDKYDIRKTKGKVKVSEKALYSKPKIGFSLEKLRRKYSQVQFIEYLVANFVSGDKWGGLYNTGAGEEIYKEWAKRSQSQLYEFKQDLSTLHGHIPNLGQAWDATNGHPLLLRLYFGKSIQLETLVILNKLFRFKQGTDAALKGDPIWSEVSKLLYKYSPFIQIDKDKYMMTTREIFQDG